MNGLRLRRAAHARDLVVVGAALGALALPAQMGCTSSAPSQSGPRAQSGAGGAGANDGAGANGGDGGSGLDDLDPGGGTVIDPASACAHDVREAVPLPVAVFLAVDKSGSMNQFNRWEKVKAAFLAFFEDSDAASIHVALRFWPDPGCDDLTCSVVGCSQPLVDLAPLSDPAQQQALEDAFASKSPQGETNMSAALGGATTWAHDHVVATGGAEKVAIVLVTDGVPTVCDTNMSHIAAYASTAHASDGILTYAVGLAGSDHAGIDAIAAAGGTQKGFFLGDDDVQAALLDALLVIAGQQLTCEFTVPEGEPGAPTDPHQVNVNYTSGAAVTQTIANVGDAASCGAAGGWYYDDPVAPKIIYLCPSTCQSVEGDAGGKLEVILGCETIPG